MSRASLFSIAVTLFLFLVLGYIAGLLFQLFWTVWWYDMVLHIMGGLAVGLLFGSLLAVRRDTFAATLYKMFVPVVLAAIVWEYVEFQRKAFFANDYMLDTTTDLMMGVAGGLLAALVVSISARRNG